MNNLVEGQLVACDRMRQCAVTAVYVPFEITDYWFNKYHVNYITQEFIDWWIEYYQVPSDYDYSEQHEYYIRMAFALAGWNANKFGKE